MSTSQLQQTMATLRMSLAEIEHKEQQLNTLINQFRTQVRRLPRQFIYGRTPLDASISAMGEIEERLADALTSRRRLTTIKKPVTDELAALESVKQVDEARQSLSELKRRGGSGRRGHRHQNGDPAVGAVHRRPQQTGRAGHNRTLRGEDSRTLNQS